MPHEPSGATRLVRDVLLHTLHHPHRNIRGLQLIPSVNPPPLAYTLAAEAIADLHFLSTPEDMARAALDVAWALVKPPNRGQTREEVELVRELNNRHYHWKDIARMMASPLDRISHICEINGIQSHSRGPRHAHNQEQGLDGLTDVVRKARQ